MRLEHPDFVRCIAIHPVTGTIFTGCRDEEIRCWDSTVSLKLVFGTLWSDYADRCASKTGQLVAEISGHYGEVTSLLIPPNSPTRLLSSSLDGTIRLWDISSEGMLAHAKQWKDKLAEAEEKQQAEKRTKAGVLTEEEERELAELLEDD